MQFASLFVLSVICTCVKIVLADIDYSICNPLNITLVPPPPPQLPESFTAQIEWKWLNKNMTIDVSEVSNGIRKISSQNVVMEGQTTQLIYDFTESQLLTYSSGCRYHARWYLYRQPSQVLLFVAIIHWKDKETLDNGCSVQAMGSLAFHDDKVWLSAMKMIYGIARQADATYMGANHTIRNTNAGMWRACLDLYQFNITVQVDMYFQGNWFMAASNPTQMVPLRFEMIGSTNHNGTAAGRIPFHVIGDITYFDPFPTLDETQLQVPPGVFCPGRASRKPMNLLPTSFSVSMEKIDMDNKRITYQDIYYDSGKRLVRRDYKEASANDPDSTMEVFDFNLGVHYNMDPYMGTCQPISALTLGDMFVANNGNSTIRMQSANEFFHSQNANIQYAGTRKTRGVTCDVWVGEYLDIEAYSNFTAEWYFTKDSWRTAVGSIIQPASLFRINIWQGSGSRVAKLSPIEWNIIRMENVAPTQDVFNVAPCFPPPHRIRMIVHFFVTNRGPLTYVSASYLRDTLHIQLVDAALLPPLRIAGVSIIINGDSDLYFDATLLDNAPVLNRKIVPPPPTQHSLIAAFEFLKGVVSSGKRVNISSTTQKYVLLKADAIVKINYMQEFATTPRTTVPSTRERTPPTPEKTPSTYKPETPTERTPSPPPKTSMAPPTEKQITPCECPQITCPPIKPITCAPQTPCPQLTCPSCSTTPCSCKCPQVTCPSTTITPCPSPKTCPPLSCPACKSTSCPSQTPCPQTTCPTTKPCVKCPNVTCPKQKPCLKTCPTPKIATKCPPLPSPLPCTSQSSTVSNTQQTGKSKQTGVDNPGISGGAVGAIAVAMAIVGVLIGVFFLLIYNRYRTKRPSDKRNILDKYLDNENNY